MRTKRKVKQGSLIILWKFVKCLLPLKLIIQSYAKDFFGFMWKVEYDNKESIMSRIFGLYEISINNNTYYYMVGFIPSCANNYESK